MHGSTLFPLTILRQKYPALYRREVKKYLGREKVMGRMIPLLHCKWNAAIHLSIVHPALITRALERAGLRKKEKWEWFKIDTQKLDPKKGVIFLYREKKGKWNFPENYFPLSDKKLEQERKLPSKARAYYQKEIEMGRRPLFFHLIPHVLYRGSISVKDTEIIET